MIDAVKVAANVTENYTTIEFSADPSHPMTSFQCKLDGNRYRSCKYYVQFKVMMQ